jgi:hypothetical protein
MGVLFLGVHLMERSVREKFVTVPRRGLSRAGGGKSRGRGDRLIAGPLL